MTNPNSLIPENNRDRKELLVGDLGERVIPLGGKKPAYFNPNYLDPGRIAQYEASNSPKRNVAAGVSTNYGVVPKIN